MTAAAGQPGQGDWLPRAAGLSCYTANLGGYLAGEMPDAGRRLAESVRLAVRTDLPDGLAFSHHRYPLDVLGDGTMLRYASAGAAEEAEAGLAGELRRHGRVLAVVDNAKLAWSPASGGGPPAPHWLLVTGRDGDTWQVADGFSGLLPAGEQKPYAGPVTTGDLLAAMTPPPRWSAEQRRRDELAFGFPVPVPSGPRIRWLRRVRGGGAGAGPALPGDWLTEDEAVLPFLARRMADEGATAARHAEDLWSAAGHRVFRYRWLASQPRVPGPDRQRFAAAESAWARLPAALRFAAGSAGRGRPRASLIAATFDNQLSIEAGLVSSDPGRRRDPR